MSSIKLIRWGQYRHRFPPNTPLSAPFTPPCPSSSSVLARFSFTSRAPLELPRYASGRRTLTCWNASPAMGMTGALRRVPHWIFVYALHVLFATSCALLAHERRRAAFVRSFFHRTSTNPFLSIYQLTLNLEGICRRMATQQWGRAWMVCLVRLAVSALFLCLCFFICSFLFVPFVFPIPFPSVLHSNCSIFHAYDSVSGI
jgi:hypothetical protein